MSEQLFDAESLFDPDDYHYFYENRLNRKRTLAETEFIVRELQMNSPLRILDLACGFGRHANMLAGMGHTVTGVDLIEGFLEMAQSGAQQSGYNVTYIRADMRNALFDGGFDRVLLLFTAFGYFDEDGNREVLNNIFKSLDPGGLLCFDVLNRDRILKDMPRCEVIERGEDLMIERTSFDSLSGRLTNKRIIVRDGQRRDKPYSIRLYNAGELTALLTKTGFVVENLFGGFDGATFVGESGRIVVIARKPA